MRAEGGRSQAVDALARTGGRRDDRNHRQLLPERQVILFFIRSQMDNTRKPWRL